MPPTPPRVGMLATVRGRRALVASVEPYDHPTEGRLHLATVEYLDADGAPDDRLLWEREPGAELVEPRALPDPTRAPAMPPADLDALVRATRWTALEPYVDPDGAGPVDRLPITAPFHGAVQVEDFQLVPLLKALRMPRIALLLADDVGLGKTVEAGLVLQELVLRRRARRALVLCPASLRSQWVQELRDKFALTAEEVTRDTTHKLRKRLGLDASPWRTFPRVVTSYQYLRQPDVNHQQALLPNARSEGFLARRQGARPRAAAHRARAGRVPRPRQGDRAARRGRREGDRGVRVAERRRRVDAAGDAATRGLRARARRPREGGAAGGGAARGAVPAVAARARGGGELGGARAAYEGGDGRGPPCQRGRSAAGGASTAGPSGRSLDRCPGESVRRSGQQHGPTASEKEQVT